MKRFYVISLVAACGKTAPDVRGNVFTFGCPAPLTQLSITCFTLKSNHIFFLNRRHNTIYKSKSLKYV